ncbi:uncharacterized protein LOC135217560 [Macrobrachium nipponense]|uniref:uncharacterized protein LOC135217560 n=1 Tax=Macrobrachium nipponense TaxID=159736 RepID=UPI0030C7DC79
MAEMTALVYEQEPLFKVMAKSLLHTMQCDFYDFVIARCNCRKHVLAEATIRHEPNKIIASSIWGTDLFPTPVVDEVLYEASKVNQSLRVRVNANNHGNSNENNSLSLPAPLRESSWHRSGSQSDHHNILPQENGSVTGLSGSEVSDSGLTSEDEDSRALYRNVKNLSLSPGAQSGMPGILPWTSLANIGTHPRPQYPPSPQQCHPSFPHHNYQYLPQQNLPNNQGSSRSVANSESSIYDRLVYNESHLTNNNPQEADELWINQEGTDHTRVRKPQNEADTAGSSPEHAPHPLGNDTEFRSFESLVSSAVRASVDLLQSHVGGVVSSSNTVTSLLLCAIHSTVVGQIQTQAQSLNLPQSFLFSVDTELKTALQAFVGKRLLEVNNEVPSVISQLLLTQYCTVLVQRLRDTNPTLPQTPTKLPPNKQAQMSEANCEVASSAASAVHSRHAQENTTATQTESSLFSVMPHQHSGQSSSSSDNVQRPNFHTSHSVSMISGASGVSHTSSLPSHSTCHPSVHSSNHSSSPHPPPHITNSMFQSSSSASGQWQAPFTVPVPLSSGPSGVSETSHEGDASNLPTSQPEAWAASCLGQVTESPASLSRPESRSAASASQSGCGAVQEWAEPEHEEAVMDEEPLLPVYDLAEADQSQDAGDAAEGDWEDSQAEGIQADAASGITDESPEHPIRLQVDVEGMAECEADAADVSGRGAIGHMLYGDHLVQVFFRYSHTSCIHFAGFMNSWIH